jgi:hypothetical protein
METSATAQEIYDEYVRDLSVEDRVRLLSMIVDDLETEMALADSPSDERAANARGPSPSELGYTKGGDARE